MKHERIVPDILNEVGYEGGKFLFSEAYDVIHRFRFLGFSLLKYINGDTQTVSNVPLNDDQAGFLIEQVGLYAVERRTITQHEQEIYEFYQDSMLDDLFGGTLGE